MRQTGVQILAEGYAGQTQSQVSVSPESAEHDFLQIVRYLCVKFDARSLLHLVFGVEVEHPQQVVEVVLLLIHKRVLRKAQLFGKVFS